MTHWVFDFEKNFHGFCDTALPTGPVAPALPRPRRTRAAAPPERPRRPSARAPRPGAIAPGGTAHPVGQGQATAPGHPVGQDQAPHPVGPGFSGAFDGPGKS